MSKDCDFPDYLDRHIHSNAAAVGRIFFLAGGSVSAHDDVTVTPWNRYVFSH